MEKLDLFWGIIVHNIMGKTSPTDPATPRNTCFATVNVKAVINKTQLSDRACYFISKMENVLKEIAQFLKPDARIDLKTVALQHIIGKHDMKLLKHTTYKT